MILFNSPVHLGDTDSPMIFPGVPFIGLRLALPLTLPSVATDVNLSLSFTTSKIETWAEWQSHKVFLQEELIGVLADANDTAGDSEIRILTVNGDVLKRLPRFVTLRLEVGQQDPGMADDFTLKEISAEGLNIRLGWVPGDTNTFHETISGGGANLPNDAPVINGGGADLPDDAPRLDGGNAFTR